MVLGDVFGPSDALVAVAAIGLVGTFVTSVVNARRSKRTETAARAAVYNTQPNGEPDKYGRVGPPSSFDRLMASHEYMIGLTHAVREQAEEAAKAAYMAQAAVKQNDVRTEALIERVDAGFAAAAEEREGLGGRLDSNIEDGSRFASSIIAGALEILGRLDALDGKQTESALRAQIDQESDQ